jgi:hypothetical protein
MIVILRNFNYNRYTALTATMAPEQLVTPEERELLEEQIKAENVDFFQSNLKTADLIIFLRTVWRGLSNGIQIQSSSSQNLYQRHDNGRRAKTMAF